MRYPVSAITLAISLLTSSLAHAQVDCWAPREQQNSVTTARFAPIRQTLLSIEDIIRRNIAYQTPPEPVRMRTTISAGPGTDSGAQVFVRAYPPVQTTADIRIWTKDRCDVIPQAERVAASVGQVYAFINYHIKEQFLGGDEVPDYQGEFAGYPVYNGWIVMTKDRQLPWIPQTLRDRLDREEQKRQRALDDWNQLKTGRKLPDETEQAKSYETLRKMNPAAADKLRETMREVAGQMRKAQAEEPLMDAHLQEHLTALREYRASFSDAQLNAAAVWADKSGEGRRRLDARIAELRKAHGKQASFAIQDLRAEYDVINLKPGPKEQAMAFKPDPAFPDFKDPFRPQVIALNFWSKSSPKDDSPRTVWLRRAKETIDIAAIAALLR
jgi:hypothetical protein